MTETLAASPLARATGLALIQFLWQGALIGAGTALVLTALRRSTAQARYLVACLGLVLMIAAPIVTAAGYLREAPRTAAGSPAANAVTTSDTAPASGAGRAPVTGTLRAGPFRDLITRWLPFVVIAWSAGVFVLALQLFRGWTRLWRIRRGAAPLASSEWLETARQVAARLGITRSVRLAESALVEVPAVIGWLRPVILVPASVLAGLSPMDFEAILAHELAHVRRGDYLVNAVQCVVEVLLFYHPAVWWVSGQIRLERENCCDDLAASFCENRVTYARALASLEELRADTPKLALAATGAPLLNRVRRLVEPGSPSGPRWSGGFMMSVVLTVLLFAATSEMRSMPAVEQKPMVSISEPAVVPVVAPAVVPVVAGRVAPAPTPNPVVRAAGQISGQVSDQSGGVLPGVTVTVTSVTNPDAKPTVAVTNVMGKFQFPDLADGAYDLTAELVGFKKFRARVQVAPNETVSAGIRLQIGDVRSEVTVTAPRPVSAPAPSRDVVVPPSRAADSGESTVLLVKNDQITPVSPASPGMPIRIGGSVTSPRKVRDVPPIYPLIAQTAMVTGTVLIEAVIDKEGAVRDARVVKSVALLDAAALDAVRQWQFTPTKLNGAPVDVVMTVVVNFTMR